MIRYEKSETKQKIPTKDMHLLAIPPNENREKKENRL